MPHDHDHTCGHEAHEHDHDHEAPSGQLGFQDNLYTRIDRSNVIALNANGQGSDVIKPWNERLDESKVCRPNEWTTFSEPIKFLESDADDQMFVSCCIQGALLTTIRIVRIPFTGLVRLKALLLKAGPEGHTPSKIQLVRASMKLKDDD